MEKTVIEITSNKYSVQFENVSQDKQRKVLEVINTFITGILKPLPEEEIIQLP